MQPSLFSITEWSPPTELPQLHGLVGFDLECYDPLLKSHGPGWCFRNGGDILGAALAWGEDREGGSVEKGYWSIGHRGYAPHSPEQTLRWLKDQAKRPELTWAMHNASYDLGWCRRYGIHFSGKIICTATAAPLIDENRRGYDLDSLSQDYLGERKDKSLFVEARRALRLPKNSANTAVMGRLRELPAQYVGEYAEQDAVLTRKLWYKFKPIIDKEDLWQIFNLESDLIPVLLAMRERGVRVDVEGAARTAESFNNQLKEINAEMKRLSGVDVQVWAAETIARAFDKVGIDYRNRTGGFVDADAATYQVGTGQKAPSFRAGWLETIEHPLAKLIVRGRKLDKAKNTFIEGAILAHQVDGRCHVVFSPLRRSTDEGEHAGGAVTGRFSSSNFNMQNLPSDRSDADMAELIRGFFLPDDPLWGSVDWSGQEPRLMVHFAHLARIKGVEPMFKAFHENPKLKFHQIGADITGLRLRVAKDVTLGRMYGMGGAKMCKTYLGLPTKWITTRDGKRQIEVAGDEGALILKQYDEALPFVKGINDLCTRKAEQRGWIRTVLGRVRHFESDAHPNGARAYKALNCLIQGSAADMMKKAMVDMYKAGITPLCTVHDELGLSCASPEKAMEYKQIMIDAVKLTVPIECDVELGVSWGASGAKEKKAA